MIVSKLSLTRADIRLLRVTDPYSIHRVVYSLFEDIRIDSDKKTSISSGILYADKGADRYGNNREILILSNRMPMVPEFGTITSKMVPESFLMHEHYTFEVTVNPSKRDKKTGKTVAVRGCEAIKDWFINKTLKSWGFMVHPEKLDIEKLDVNVFRKKDHTITQGSAIFKGVLTVIDRKQFVQSFQQGIGRGRAFGFGLLQIVPILS